MFNGIVLQFNKLKSKTNMGENKNNILLAEAGTIVSFTISFKPSAKGCNKPNTPTTLGPFLRWMPAITLRSNNVKYATPKSSGNIMSRIFITFIKNSLFMFVLSSFNHTLLKKPS